MRAAVNSVAQRPVAAVFPSPDRSRLVSSLVFQQPSSVDSRRRCVRVAASDADPERIGLQKDDGEEATFAPLDASSSGGLGGTTNDVFGPLALLQVGFSEVEFKEIQAFMNSMDAQMVPIMSADEKILKGKLCDAFEGEPGFREAPEGTQRAIVMSGMYTSEVMEVIAAYKDARLPPTVFAGAVPNNWDSPLAYLLDELYKDAAAAAERARLAAESYGSS